jgi:hypothetical protein
MLLRFSGPSQDEKKIFLSVASVVVKGRMPVTRAEDEKEFL